MRAPVGIDRGEGLAPKTKARIAGLLYLIIIIGGAFAQLGVRDRLVVSGNAAATAQNIAAHALLYRLGFATEVFYLLILVPLVFLLYDLFSVVNRRLAPIMVLFAATGAAVQAVILLAHYTPLIFLGGSLYLNAFSTEQLQAAAFVSLRIFDYGYMIALAFFGCFCLVLGWLILRATFFLRVIGVLLAIEGVLYLTNSFTHFVAPAVGARVFPFLLASGIAEVSLCLALLVYGVNAPRWREQAARGGVPGAVGETSRA
jgi:hypothetical protein